MSWYLEEKLFSIAEARDRNATLQDMHKFLTLWNCVCGTCILCEACIAVAYKLNEEEE